MGRTSSQPKVVSTDIENEHSTRSPGPFSDSRIQFTFFFLLLTIFLQSFNVWDSYIAVYLCQEKGFTKQQINFDLFPYWTYACLLGLLPFAFLAEYVIGYASVVAISLLLRLSTHFIVPYAHTIGQQRVGQFTYGFACSIKIVFSAFVYTLLPTEVFHQITGYIRVSNLMAHVLGGGLGWLMMETLELEWKWFFILTQSGLCVALCSFSAAVLLSRSSVDSASKLEIADKAGKSLLAPSNKSPPMVILRSIYSSPPTILWSVWWWVAAGVYGLVMNFSTVLFLSVDEQNGKNGIIFAVARLVAAGAAFTSSFSKSVLQSHGIFFMSFGSAFVSLLILVSALSSSLSVVYGCYIAMFAVFEFTFSASTASVATSTPLSLRGVALCINTFMASAMESLLQFVTGPWGLSLTPSGKFAFCSGILSILSAFLLLLNCFLSPDCPVESDDENRSKSESQMMIPVTPG